MFDHPIEIAGIVLPSSRPAFVAIVAIHIAAALISVMAGLVAAISRKGRGTHSKRGLLYFRALIATCLTMPLWPLFAGPRTTSFLHLVACRSSLHSSHDGLSRVLAGGD